MLTCNFCGHKKQCQCTEFLETDDFMCYFCNYRCHVCKRDLCTTCCGVCRRCWVFYCRDCHENRHDCIGYRKPKNLLYGGQWECASITTDYSDEYSDSDEYTSLEDLLGQCIQCSEDIIEEEDTGHCPTCEYYNEINEYVLCKRCIDTCQICHEEYCTNCMILYHEPCEQWKMCPTCHNEVSVLLKCVECGVDTYCDTCQSTCNECAQPICKACRITYNSNDEPHVYWACRACAITLDLMQTEWARLFQGRHCYSYYFFYHRSSNKSVNYKDQPK